jgi:putative glutamine amidotransferase
LRQSNHPRNILINIGITQRVEVIESYQETRDCLDQSWTAFAQAVGFNLVPLANLSKELVASYVKDLNLQAVILSGGNSLASLDPKAKDCAPLRDAFEAELITVALSCGLPIFGVCRGMQMLNVYFGGSLSPISNHVAVRHDLITLHSPQQLPQEINSFHNWAIKSGDLATDLQAVATDAKGNIEAFEHKKAKIFAIMWHPERENPYNTLDIQLFQKHLL